MRPRRPTREAKEGLIGNYIHMGSKVAALVEVNCESDFVARTEEFQALCKDLAMQVVAARPTWVRIEDIPADVLEQQKAQFRSEVDRKQARRVVERIIEGKLAKFYRGKRPARAAVHQGREHAVSRT